MLEYASDLGALARLETARTLASDRDGSLVDLLALLLAEGSIEIAKRGMLQDYVTREEALPTVRGRLLAYEQATRRFGQVAVVECRYDELETDIPENQLLAAGLSVAKRVVDYNRRNQHYRSAHQVASLFVRSLAVSDLYSPGSSDSFAFLLDMNRLFEDFVTRLLRDAFADTPVRVRPQVRDRTLITDARSGKPYAAVIPDILLEWGSETARQVPVDAKYKLYDERKIDQSDIYQTFFYAWAYAGREEAADARAFILYPGRGGSPGEHLRAQARAGDRGATIRAIAVDVPEMLRTIREGRRPAAAELMSALAP
jgi:5-methylcytosine-specific restriction enzyme subunit McrC